jgi:hypothetical protein
MVALWFAVENQSLSDKDGALFAINVSNAEVISGNEKRLWSEILDSMKPNAIGFYEPPGADERIKVQRGRFVFSELAGDEPRELSLPIDLKNWDPARRERFFDQARGSGRPVPPSIDRAPEKRTVGNSTTSRAPLLMQCANGLICY